MNYIALLLACSLAASTAIAAEKTPKKKKPEERPIVSAPTKVVRPWQPAAFFEEVDRIPEGYAGLDPKRFYEMFKKKVEGVRKKGEFETSEEFAQRTADRDAILSPINTSDLYAFRIENIGVKYDADTQIYSIGSPDDYSCRETYSFGKHKDWVTCKVASVRRESDTYIGSNAYGASRTVERIRVSDFALAIPKGSRLLSAVFSQKRYLEDTYYYRDKLSVPLEKARNLKDLKVAVLFVGRVSDARLIEGRGTLIEPKIDSPIDIFIMEEAVPFDLKKIIYYVIRTGEILDQKSF